MALRVGEPRIQGQSQSQREESQSQRDISSVVSTREAREPAALQRDPKREPDSHINIRMHLIGEWIGGEGACGRGESC